MPSQHRIVEKAIAKKSSFITKMTAFYEEQITAANAQGDVVKRFLSLRGVHENLERHQKENNVSVGGLFKRMLYARDVRNAGLFVAGCSLVASVPLFLTPGAAAAAFLAVTATGGMLAVAAVAMSVGLHASHALDKKTMTGDALNHLLGKVSAAQTGAANEITAESLASSPKFDEAMKHEVLARKLKDAFGASAVKPAAKTAAAQPAVSLSPAVKS